MSVISAVEDGSKLQKRDPGTEFLKPLVDGAKALLRLISAIYTSPLYVKDWFELGYKESGDNCSSPQISKSR